MNQVQGAKAQSLLNLGRGLTLNVGAGCGYSALSR